MAETAKKTKPSMWRNIVASVKAGSKGGKPGQWSARKAQLATLQYKKAGGGYSGKKSASNALTRWTKQKWRTKSGKPSLQTGERYLPEAAIKKLSPQEYAATTRAKREGSKQGKQFVAQPAKIAQKTKRFRRMMAKKKGN